MSIILPLQSLELAMSVSCFSLLLARNPPKDSLLSALIASAACIVTLFLQHVLFKEIFAMTGVSLSLTIGTGLLVVIAVKLHRHLFFLLCLIYGLVFAATAYEMLFYAMEPGMMLFVAAYLGITGAISAKLLAPINHPTFAVVCRVGASWIVAASILMLAFFS